LSGAITGERVVTSRAGFNPSWQRHVACYRLSEPYLGQGRIADIGCGIGHSYDLLAPRETVGIDVDPAVLRDQDRETAVADMRRLPFEDESFDGVIAIHSIEHVPDPEVALAEMVRVLKPGTTAVLATPNRLTFARPDEIIDPYHYLEFDPTQLRALSSRFFESVEVVGVVGSKRHDAFVAREHAKLAKLLSLDPLRLRRLLPRRVRQRLYDWRLGRERADSDPEAEAITVDDFSLSMAQPEKGFDLIAICQGPKGKHA
jgi:SAM-dependent methyltransferase